VKRIMKTQSFPIKRKPDIELEIKSNESVSDRQKLLDLKSDLRLGGGVSAVYVYSLVNESINYPDRLGEIVYIGEARREKRTADRFGQHISTDHNRGGDTGTNFTLSRYYWLGKKLKLRVYILDNTKIAHSRQSVETALLRWHIKEFGALPIAQGASGESYKVTMINALDIADIMKDV